MEFADGIRHGVFEFFEVFLHGGDHRRRTADEELAVGGSRVREVLLDMLLGDKTDTTLPARGRVVEDVKDLELELMDVLECLKVILEKNIILVDVGVDEGNGSTVEGVPEGGADDLDHGGDTSTTGNQAEMANHVGGVVEVTLGTLDTDGVANLQEGNVLGNVTLLIGLDDEIEVTAVIVVGNGGVASSDDLAVNLCGNGDVLANREAKNVLNVGECETVDGGVG